jgi:hypothetical protein
MHCSERTGQVEGGEAVISVENAVVARVVHKTPDDVPRVIDAKGAPQSMRQALRER